MNYVLYGTESYLLKESLAKILLQHGIHDEMNKVVYDARKTDAYTVMEDAQTYPFFSECKAIIVQNANFLSPSDDTNWDLHVLEEYLKQPLESTILIFIGSFEKLDARKKIVKKLQSVCKVLQFRKLDEQGKRRFVDEQLKKRGISIERNARELLLSRMPFDILMIQNELSKLELYGDTITTEVVSSIVTRPLEDDVFQLVNAVVEKRIKEAFHIWKDLSTLNKDAVFLIALLAGQFRFLYQVRELLDEGKQQKEITAVLGAHPYRVQRSMQTVMYLSTNALLNILERLATLDQQIKSGKLDKNLGFEMFLLHLRGV